MTGNCTHLSLYTGNLPATEAFYTRYLGCTLIRSAEDEGTLVVDMGSFRLVFSKPKSADFSAGVATAAAIDHIGYEFPRRAEVEEIFTRLQTSEFSDAVLTSGQSLQNSPATGPFRFYVRGPNGYVVEVHSWDGCDAE